MDNEQDGTEGARRVNISETQQEARVHADEIRKWRDHAKPITMPQHGYFPCARSWYYDFGDMASRASTEEMPPEQLAPLLAECASGGAA